MSIVKDLSILWLCAAFSGLIVFLFCSFRQILIKQREYFIKTLSHDIRVSVLAQLRGLDLLTNSDLSENDKYELLDEVKNSCKYTFDMITMLANSYRYERKNELPQKEIIDLKELFKIIVSESDQMIKEKRIKFDCNLDLNTIEAEYDTIKKAIKIILSTALANAEKDSRISCFSCIKNNSAILQITYNGLQISDDEKNRMFCENSRFSTVGHGIKMYLCRKIIEFHKGKIIVDLRKNNTTVFTVKLPDSRLNSQSEDKSVFKYFVNNFNQS